MGSRLPAALLLALTVSLGACAAPAPLGSVGPLAVPASRPLPSLHLELSRPTHLLLGPSRQGPSGWSRSELVHEVLRRHMAPLLEPPAQPRAGRVVLELRELTTEHPDHWDLPTWGTLGLATLFGMPHGEARVEVELEVAFFDVHGVLLGRYGGWAAASAHNALWWGHDGGQGGEDSPLDQAALVAAVSEALRVVTAQMQPHLPSLRDRLGHPAPLAESSP